MVGLSTKLGRPSASRQDASNNSYHVARTEGVPVPEPICPGLLFTLRVFTTQQATDFLSSALCALPRSRASALFDGLDDRAAFMVLWDGRPNEQSSVLLKAGDTCWE